MSLAGPYLFRSLKLKIEVHSPELFGSLAYMACPNLRNLSIQGWACSCCFCIFRCSWASDRAIYEQDAPCYVSFEDRCQQIIWWQRILLWVRWLPIGEDEHSIPFLAAWTKMWSEITILPQNAYQMSTPTPLDFFMETFNIAQISLCR